MENRRLETIVYAEGFIESFIEEYIENIDEETAGPQTLEQASQVKNMWLVLSTGLAELRRENRVLQSKINAAALALL